MFSNYWKLAFRHLARKKVFSFINIFGLTIGLTSCILIGLYITDELSFDSSHQKADRIARITSERSSGGTLSLFATTGTKAGPQLKRVFPEVEDYTRTLIYSTKVTYGPSSFTEPRFLYADASFLNIFTFPLVEGDLNALNETTNIILTAAAAKKYFGSADPLNKVLRINDEKDYRVAAVVADPPSNTQLQFDFIVSFNNLYASRFEQWYTANYVTYLLVGDGRRIPALEQQINRYMESPSTRQDAALQGKDYLHYHLEPLKKVHLYSSLEGFTPNGSITYILILTGIAILILVIAGFNYTNLAIAQSSSRTGEIGVRKVLGAVRGQLFLQFTGESLLITMIALILAILAASQLIPVFNGLTGKDLHAIDLLRLQPLAVLLLTGLVIGVLAGAYPALVLANTRIINILRSGFRITGGKGGLRRTLIVLQFIISFFLISATIVILQQIDYIKNKRLGLDRDHVLVVSVNNHALTRYSQIKSAMLTRSGVESISGSHDLPVSARWGDILTADNGRQEVHFPIKAIPSDMDFLKTMKMQLIAGSDFTAADIPTHHIDDNDSVTPVYRFILNETAVRKIGWTPQQAIGQKISRGVPGIVKGVVKDFNFASLHDEIGPLMIFADTQWVRYMLVRVKGDRVPTTIASLQATWKTYVPDQTFEYHFLDEDYNRLYQSETRTASLFSIFASLAILLACLGLFGLSALSAIQRTKEIGIRKVLGASLLNITLLMARNFVLLVGLALLIATPLAWLAASRWLGSFAYRIDVQPWVFLLAGAAGVLLAFLTVSYHSLRVGSRNPSETLSTE
jgi:putative ABC transport system permease protein